MTAEAPLADPPRPGEDAAPASLLLDQPFDANTLHQLRAAVLAHAARAGLPEDRAGDVMLAVHELAANTVRHGAGAGRLLVCTRPGVLQCQVLDAGAASPSGHAGDTGGSPPPWPILERHGLWLVRQVADQFSIAPWHGGYQVTALFALPASRKGLPQPLLGPRPAGRTALLCRMMKSASLSMPNGAGLRPGIWASCLSHPGAGDELPAVAGRE